MKKAVQWFSILMILCNYLIAQNEGILDEFTAYRNNDKIILKWIITSGSTCDGIKILRAEDTLAFKQIGFIPGVCGSSTNAVPYQFTDPAPLANKVNYYRLELGTVAMSEITSLEFIVLSNDGFFIRPHPFTEQTTIYFQNNARDPHQFRLSDNKGRTVQLMENITDDFIMVSRRNLVAGVYFFSIEYNNAVKTKGKLVIQ